MINIDIIKNASVKVAFNRHKQLWSVRNDTKVIGYTEALLLKDVVFTVSEAGRQRCILHNQRNVHAFACGKLIQVDEVPEWEGLEQIGYNPFRGPDFYLVDTRTPVRYAPWVITCGSWMFIKH
jgi:hypothetical protein